MGKLKAAAIAVIAALVIEAFTLLIWIRAGNFGGDGGDLIGTIGLVFHYPGLTMADSFGFPKYTEEACTYLWGAFLWFWLCWWLIAKIWCDDQGKGSIRKTRHIQREWISTKDGHLYRATYIREDEDTVVVQRCDDNKLVIIQKALLADLDKEYLHKIHSGQAAEQGGPGYPPQGVGSADP